MSKGISGSGDGFDLPGRRLGGFSRQPPLSSLRQTALSAAENRARQGILLPSGPKRLGGDKTIMSALTPVQAAAMAAERRFQDDLWCGLEEIVDEEESRAGDVPQENRVQNVKNSVTNAKSQKRSCQVNNGHSDSNFVDLTDVPSGSTNKRSRQKEREATMASPHDLEKDCIDLTGESSTSGSKCNQNTGCNIESSGWECTMCTLLNPVSIQYYISIIFFFLIFGCSLMCKCWKISILTFVELTCKSSIHICMF